MFDLECYDTVSERQQSLRISAWQTYTMSVGHFQIQLSVQDQIHRLVPASAHWAHRGHFTCVWVPVGSSK